MSELDDTFQLIDSLEAKKVLPTSTIIAVVISMFLAVQIVFVIVNYKEEYLWQAIGMIVSTNFAAVWLTIRGNQQVEDMQRKAKTVYRPEVLKFVHWSHSLMTEISAEINEPEKKIEELAPIMAKVLDRYYTNKDRLERLSKIEDEEVFMSAMEEVIR